MSTARLRADLALPCSFVGLEPGLHELTQLAPDSILLAKIPFNDLPRCEIPVKLRNVGLFAALDERDEAWCPLAVTSSSLSPAVEQRASSLAGDVLVCCIVSSIISPDRSISLTMGLNTKQYYLSLVPNNVPKRTFGSDTRDELPKIPLSSTAN
ncbi:hypothetical protein P171DRAFT_88913 [Karstenula rhodostoma CBS 690.94]|uniref:Uncharacterized protein n=1 Tax=Karstenula rhodostoma CBS 690.94 TaxID=1392251 RepID=A0A9P4PDQ4_9PLEO|nr:hypothetical protein P171DRAFT_88913 [Karstenula rhodostoma CBS 690.94]